jgi:Eukaryotic translation initiation factor 3 subunit 7 (eIF-3)
MIPLFKKLAMLWPSRDVFLTLLQLISEDSAHAFATDSILAMLMCAPRSVFGWDIIVIRDGDKLIFDKRDGGSSGEFELILLFPLE